MRVEPVNDREGGIEAVGARPVGGEQSQVSGAVRPAQLEGAHDDVRRDLGGRAEVAGGFEHDARLGRADAAPQ